jgi:SPP1 family predicted phage head-tail adaptor
MRVLSGKRDTLIRFQRRERMQSPTTGSWKTGNWVNVDPPVWAEVFDILPSRSESQDANVVITRRPCRIRCLYRDDITSDMRVTIGDRTLEIVAGPAEIGRRAGIELRCQELTTQGDAP